MTACRDSAALPLDAGTGVKRAMGRVIVSLSLAVALWSGCAITGRGPEEYRRDGVQYGVTAGTFRGRWWNYYERGRSFQDGGFYAEAERDFRKAIEHRARDQRWARTYGLHFAPEYFPQRELGITLYYKNEIDEAVRLLETSVEQEHSARAAYYLNEARAAQVKASARDVSPPSIEIIGPTSGAVAASRRVDAVLRVYDDTFVRGVSVNGEPVMLDVVMPEAQLSHTLMLEPGENTVVAQAVDIVGNSTETRITLRTDVDGPVVSFESPIVAPGTVRGEVFDPAGVESLRIDGVEADLEPSAGAAQTFAVNVERIELGQPLLFACADALGNETRGPVPIDTLRVSALDDVIVPVSGVRTITFGNGLEAQELGGRILAITRVAQAPPDNGPVITLLNVEDGQKFLKDEVIVSVQVSSPSPLSELRINDRAVDTLLPGRLTQIVSRRVPLAAEGENALVVRVRDTAGHEAETRATLLRELTAVEQIDNRLSVAILGNVWDGSVRPEPSETEFVLTALSRRLYEGGRFDLLSRDALPRVLEEQELAAAISGGGIAPLRAVVPAELLVIGRARRSADSLELILQGVDPGTSQILAYADVAGPVAGEGDLQRLIDDLAQLFEQAFPRIQGSVVDVRSPTRCYTSLTQADRVRRAMRCLVFRKGAPIVHPRTGEVLGVPTEIVAEGRFEDVQTRLSSLELTSAGAEGAEQVAVDDFVITK